MSLGVLFGFAKPVYQNGELMDGGGDITTGTVAEYLHDMIYIAGLAQLVHGFWKYGWTLLLIVRSSYVKRTDYDPSQSFGASFRRMQLVSSVYL